MSRATVLTLLLTAGIFVGSVFMVPLVGIQFVPIPDEGRFQINVTTPTGSSLDYTTIKLGQVESALREFPEIASTYSVINTGSPYAQASSTVSGRPSLSDGITNALAAL